jgi:DNA-binding IclR family transcriptional regulator
MQSVVPHTGPNIQVIDRAVTLLDLLAASERPVGMTELARGAGLSKTTTRRVLASLERHKLCERTPEGQYRLGLKLFELGMFVQERLDLRERSRAELTRLAEASKLTAFLCIREDRRAICIERIDGPYAHSLALRLGGALPLHTGAAPLVLLAYCSDEEVEQYLEHEPLHDGLTERTATTREEILARVHSVRERGYAVSNQDVTTGVAAIGAPVFDHSRTLVASISVSGLTPHVLGKNEGPLVEQVCAAAAAVSRELGFETARVAGAR